MKKILASGMIGNALEWYDFGLFIQFATIISKHFFPSNDPALNMIATFGVFAAGFFMRPLGGIVFGRIGDKFGRKIALSGAILVMAIPTACIGLLPTYNQIGIAAPILLTIIRLLQGLSLGGEFSGCISYIVEHAPRNSRGIAGSSSFFSLCLGILLSSVVATLMTHLLGEKDLIEWGWRIPFILSIFIGLIGLHIRHNLDESPLYIEAKKNGNLSARPVREVFNDYRRELFIAMGLYLTVTVPFYTLTAFIPNYMLKILNYSVSYSLFVNSISLVVMMIVLPISGYISDKIGRRPVLVFSTWALIVMIYPIFWMLNQAHGLYPIISQIIFAIILASYMGPIPTLLVELFPTKVRFTGVAISYNMSAAIFGGTVPMIGFKLISITNNNNILALYIMVFSSITLYTLSKLKESYKTALA